MTTIMQDFDPNEFRALAAEYGPGPASRMTAARRQYEQGTITEERAYQLVARAAAGAAPSGRIPREYVGDVRYYEQSGIPDPDKLGPNDALVDGSVMRGVPSGVGAECLADPTAHAASPARLADRNHSRGLQREGEAQVRIAATRERAIARGWVTRERAEQLANLQGPSLTDVREAWA